MRAMTEFLKYPFHLTTHADLLLLDLSNRPRKSARKRYGNTKKRSKGHWSAGDRFATNAASS